MFHTKGQEANANQIDDQDDWSWNPFDFLTEDPVENLTHPEQLLRKVEGSALDTLKKLDIPKQPYKVAKDGQSKGVEVGDDNTTLSPSIPRLLLNCAVQREVLRMNISWTDTFISSKMWNLCETTG